MKKKIITTLCVLITFFSLVLTVYAHEGKKYIYDEVGKLGNSDLILNQEAGAASDKLGVQITFLLAKTTNGKIEEYTNSVYQNMFGNMDGIMLTISVDESIWSMGKYGNMKKLITDKDEIAMWDAFCVKEYYDECIRDYINKASEILESKGYGVSDTTDETTENIIPEERQLPRLVDDADILTDEEESNLQIKLDDISERQKCDVAVVTVNTLDGKTSTEYADDYYDYNGYGYGKDDDGILLLISMEDRDWAITTYGYGIIAFTDAGQEYMVGEFKQYLSNGEYEKAFTKFAELCDDFITQAKTGEPYDNGNLPKGKVANFWIPFDIIIGCCIAFTKAIKKVKESKTVMKKGTANAYTGSLNLYRNSDIQYNKKVTSYTISTRNSSSGPHRTGSSTHVSSSGRSHGGSSGKF